jgi:hypothetical protein
MAYNITKSDGTPLATIADGQTNSTATSLTLVGKNFAGYGTFLNENFVKLLEHFANSTEPANPKAGQLWYQTSTRLLQVYDGIAWKSVSGAQNVADEPTYKVAGDLWFDSVNQQLKVWSGAGWVVIGPSFTSTTGTSGAVADTVIDSSQFSHVVVKFFVQNQLVAVLSKDATFQPATTIPGFPSIKPGLNLARGTTPELVFYENANNASFLGQIAADQYLTKDNALLTSKLVIRNNDGVELEDPSGTGITNFQLRIDNNDIQLNSLIRGNGLVLNTKPDNAGGATQTVLRVDKVTGLITVLNDPTSETGISTKNYVDTRDNNTRTMLQNNVLAINSNVSTLSANVGGNPPGTSIYSNVRTIQTHLGFRKGGPGSQDDLRYTELTVTNNDSFVNNIFTLWGNVSSIVANVLTRTGDGGPGGTAGSSMYANVRSLQGRASVLENETVRRDGTLSITGILVPDTTHIRDFGSSSKRFGAGYINSMVLGSSTNDGANLPAGTIQNLRSINFTGSRGKYDPITLVANPLTVTGNIKFNDNIDGTPTANLALGIDGPLRVQGALSVTGSIAMPDAAAYNEVYDIGVSGTRRYNNIYVKTVNADALNVSGGIGGAGVPATFGTVTSRDIIPESDALYSIGNSSGPRRYVTVHASSFSSSNFVSLGASGITWAGTDATVDIGTSLKRFNILYAKNWQGESLRTTSAGLFLQTGIGTNTIDIGASGAIFRTVYATTFNGKATSAQYADLAERFAADAPYAPGTLVRIGGAAEVTVENEVASTEVLGVVSSQPAHLMNAEAGSNETHPPIAMVGRVPVRCIGEIRKGDRLISAGNGCAMAAKFARELGGGQIIGRALADKLSNEEGLVEAIVKVSV